MSLSVEPWTSVSELRVGLQSGALSAVSLTEQFLRRCRQDNGFNAWLRLDEQGALEMAEGVDKRLKSGEAVGPLAGIPVGVKDMICTRGLETTAASKMLSGFVPPYDATVVERLRAADAIIIGKLNMDEFGMGSSNENSAYGPVANPWASDRVPGGSSGASAAVLAKGDCPLSLGTDTGGSIRQPASFCGVVGLRPTYGRVSRYGVIAFASSLDQVGPLGRTVADTALLLQVLAGHDPKDSTSLAEPVPCYTEALSRDVNGLRIGVPSEYFDQACHASVREATHKALADFEAVGAVLVPISLPHTSYAVATYYVLATAEASSNLARYDGVRYGHRARGVDDLEGLYAMSRAEGFGSEVVRRIMLGTFALSSGYYDAYYRKAQQARGLIRGDFEAAFRRCDLIATPTAPTTAYRLGEHQSDPLAMYLMDIFTVPSSLAGLPCMSLPCGFDDNDLPIGLQLIGPRLEESRLLNAAHRYEQLRPWHQRHPMPVNVS